MDISIKTLGELKKSGYRPRSIKSELRENLLENIKKGEDLTEDERAKCMDISLVLGDSW